MALPHPRKDRRPRGSGSGTTPAAPRIQACPARWAASPQEHGIAAYESARRHALLAFLAPSVICSVIYLAPAMILLRTLVRRPDIIAGADHALSASPPSSGEAPS
ncbi:hypothetical protein GCM10027026_08060 [Myroides odoratimimus subsp. xuanwuensis]